MKRTRFVVVVGVMAMAAGPLQPPLPLPPAMPPNNADAVITPEVSQPPIPGDEEQRGPQQPKGSDRQKPATDNQRGTAGTPLIVKLLNAADHSTDSGAANPSSLEKSPPDRWGPEWSIVWATLGLIVIGILQAGMFFVQLRYMRIGMNDTRIAAEAARDAANETRKSVELARDDFIASHRPRLRIRNIIVEPPVVKDEHPMVFRPGHVVRGRYFVANYGDSIANIIETYSQVYWTNVPLPMTRPYEEELATSGGGEKIQSGGARAYRFQSDRAISERESDDVLHGGNCQLYVMGWLEYTDIAGTRRRTAFCQMYDAERRRFHPVKDIDYEHEE